MTHLTRRVTVELLESRRLLSAVRLGSIGGSVYSDLDRDGVHEVGEAGVRGATVFLDLNNNNRLDKNEPKAVTDKRGGFVFSNLKPGTYRLREMGNPQTTAISAPKSGWFKVTLAAGQNVVRRMFGNVTLTSSSKHATTKYTYNGDTDLNGKVDGADYARIGSTGNLGSWFNGDFDYNGKINGTDYELIDKAFNQQTTTPRTAKSAAAEDFKITQAERTSWSAKGYLTGDNKFGVKTAAVQAVLDDFKKFGDTFKREYLELAKHV